MESMTGYIVRFVRRDFQPDEEYYYQHLEDAEYHYSLFEKDDSNLYRRIELVSCENERNIKVITC